MALPQLTSGQLRETADKLRNDKDLGHGAALFDEAADHIDMHATRGAATTFNWQGLLSFVLSHLPAFSSMARYENKAESGGTPKSASASPPPPPPAPSGRHATSKQSEHPEPAKG
jgi:hypothetical protein